MLASKPILQQLRTPECISLGLIFTGNVYALQLYLGTARIQLEEMGDNNKVYLQMLSFIVPGVQPCMAMLESTMQASESAILFEVSAMVYAGVFVLAPFNGYLLDRLGFGIVLLVINFASLATAVLQSIPVLELQVRARFSSPLCISRQFTDTVAYSRFFLQDCSQST